MTSAILLQRLSKFFRSSQTTLAIDCAAALTEEGAPEGGFRWDKTLPELIENLSAQVLARASGEGWNVGGAASEESSEVNRETQRLLMQVNTVRTFFVRSLNRFQATQTVSDGFTASDMTQTRQEASDIFERLITAAVADWLAAFARAAEPPKAQPPKPEPPAQSIEPPQAPPAEPKQPGSSESAALEELRAGIHSIGLLLGKMRVSNPQGVESAVSGATRHLQRMNSLLEALGLQGRTSGEIHTEHSVRFAPLAVRPFMESLAESFRPLAEQKGLRFAMAADPTLVTVHTDAPKLQRAASLLLGNAVQYTIKGGISLIARPSGTDWHLTIEDTGPGIEPARLANFLTGDMMGPDRIPHGISVARSLLHMLGGHLDVDSMLRRGSRFSICLPKEHPSKRK